MKQRSVILVTGPTAVGKTGFVSKLAAQWPIEVINGDMGQMYTPLTIGTAKPAWHEDSVPHHLFDILSQPMQFSALKYRERVCVLIEQIWEREKIPVIVGGSSFYLLSLFFTSAECVTESAVQDVLGTDIWDQLRKVDPKRAQEIHPNDTYRAQRALAIWHTTGIKPSVCRPTFNPFASSIVIWLDRDRADLYERINQRVCSMMQTGWIAEAKSLEKGDWKQFLYKKKIIGYDLIFDYLAGMIGLQELYSSVQKRTRNYAKRQITFWRSFKKKLQEAPMQHNGIPNKPVGIHELNLTHGDIESYIKHLKDKVLV